MTTKEANPLVWGAVTGVLLATIIATAHVVGSTGPDNPLLETPLSAGGAGFVLGYLVAMFRNWWSSDRRRW